MSNDAQNFRPLFMVHPEDPEANCTLSLYFEQSDLTRLLALVKEYGILKVYKEGQDFLLDFGPHRFLVRNKINEALLSLKEAKEFTAFEARKLLLLADFLFFERKSAFMTTTLDPIDEFEVWAMCRELKLDLEAYNPEQGERFQTWAFEAEQRKRLIFGHIGTKEREPLPKPQGFTPSALETHEVSIWFNTTERLRVLELIEALQSFELYYQNEVLQLVHEAHKVSVYEHFHKSTLNIGHISALSPGAVELITKVIDLLFYDRKNRLRFELRHLLGEKALYRAFTKAKIAIAPMNKAQAERFQTYQNNPSLGKGFTGLMQQQETTPNNDNTSEPSLKR